MRRDEPHAGRVAGLVCFLVLAVATVASAAQLSVTPQAAKNFTAYGLQVDFGPAFGTDNAFVQDDSPNGETLYTATFFAKNGLTNMNVNDTHQFFRARGAGETVIRMQIKQGPANTLAFVWARVNGGGYSPALFTVFPNVNKFTIEWKAADPGTTNGYLRLYKGNNLIKQAANLDNSDYVVDLVQLGAFAGIDAATTGEMHFDEFVSTRTPFTP